MTISATNHYDPFVPNGVVLEFGFTFRADDPSWISVLIDNVEVGGYTTAINADQITNPGGTVTFAVAPTGTLLIVLRTVPLSQLTAYDPYGRFPANSHEAALDKLTMEVQDFAEVASRTAQYPIGTDPADQVQEWPTYEADKLWAWHPTVAGTVVNVVNPAVAANASAVAAAASAAAALVSENAAAASYDSFDDRYLGPKAADPALDNDGNALLAGALYWNTATVSFKVYDGAAWVTAGTVALPLAVNQGGTGSTTAANARAALGAQADVLTTGQLAFPATQNASSDVNTLDDYDEGTFTPVLVFGSGSTGITYAIQTGVYVKIGKLLTYALHIRLTSKGSSTGTAIIDGLPYSPLTSVGYPAAIGLMFQISYVGFPHVNVGSIAWNLRQTTEAGANSALSDTNFANNSEIALSGSYVVNA